MYYIHELGVSKKVSCRSCQYYHMSKRLCLIRVFFRNKIAGKLPNYRISGIFFAGPKYSDQPRSGVPGFPEQPYMMCQLAFSYDICYGSVLYDGYIHKIRIPIEHQITYFNENVNC